MYSSWLDSLQLWQCWLHLRLMRSRKGVDPLSFCLAYPTPVSVYCHPILTPSVSHAVCKMLCVQRWIKVSAMNRQLQISKIKTKSPACVQEESVTYERPERNSTLTECSFQILSAADNGADHRGLKVCDWITLCVESWKTRTHGCFRQNMHEHILHKETWIQLGSELVLETEVPARCWCNQWN